MRTLTVYRVKLRIGTTQVDTAYVTAQSIDGALQLMQDYYAGAAVVTSISVHAYPVYVFAS